MYVKNSKKISKVHEYLRKKSPDKEILVTTNLNDHSITLHYDMDVFIPLKLKQKIRGMKSKEADLYILSWLKANKLPIKLTIPDQMRMHEAKKEIDAWLKEIDNALLARTNEKEMYSNR